MGLSKKKIKEHIKLICAFFVIILIYILFTGCPIRLLTGVSCAGCGMSRAYLSLLHLNFRGAFHYHPLFICPIIFVVVFVLTKLGFPKKWAKAINCIMAALFIGVYIYRMLNPNDNVVVFEPQNGLIFKGIQFIISIIKN
ncbi:MAG: DUF2752 domain-containing protein [Oscillospiraceae bacterium]|nr:DUF2752 domain-containing protein [Oscillospiraceae bacterium]